MIRIQPLDRINWPSTGATRDDRARLVTPTLVLCGGGVGAGIGRRIKWHLNRFGTRAHVRFLVLDTDETSRQSERCYPGFDESEFCHLSMQSVRAVLEHPDRHPVLSQRLGLGDSAASPRCATLRQILNRGLEQAGQVRPLGLLAFYSNIDVVARKLDQQIGELRTLFAELEENLHETEQRVALRQRLQIVVVGSLAGGTNSSFCLDLVAYIRKLLGDDTVSVKAYYAMPSVLECELNGKSDERQRVHANTFHTLCAIDAFDDGFGSRNSVQFGSREDNLFPAPDTLHTSVFLIERKSAFGTDMQNLSNVQDVIALHVAADIGSEIGSHLEAADNNDVAQQGLAFDPIGGAMRRFSTIGAGALGIPLQKLYHYAVGREVEDFFLSVKGAPVEKRQVDRMVEDLVQKCHLQRNGEALRDTLRDAAIPSLETYLRQLYRSGNGRERRYYRNGKIAVELSRARSTFESDHRTRIIKELNTATATHMEKCREAFQETIDRILEQHGLEVAVQFLNRLESTLDAIIESCKSSATNAAEKKAGRNKQVADGKSLLERWIRKFWTSTSAQDRIITAYREYLDADMVLNLNEQVSHIANHLLATARKEKTDLTRSGQRIDEWRNHAHEMVIANTPGIDTVTTECACEVDASTPGMFKDFFAGSKLGTDRILAAVTDKTPHTLASVLRHIDDEKVFEALLDVTSQHYQQKIAATTIAELLEHELEAGGVRGDLARERVKTAMASAQPMWRVNPGHNAVRFGDTLVVAAPSSDGEGGVEHPKLKAVLDEAANALQAHRDYGSRPQMVNGSDPHRIAVVRRCHGAQLNYLNSWQEIKAINDEWELRGVHPVAVFPSELADEISARVTATEASSEEKTWVLALAFGWVARRGPFYFANLEKENGRAEVLTTSEWDGLAFQDNVLRLSTSLEKLTNSKEIVYHCRDDVDDMRRLGEGLERSRARFVEQGQLVEAIQKGFKMLRTRAGDRQVAADIREYAGMLKKRLDAVRPSSYRVVKRQIEVLYQVIGELEKGM